MEMSYSPTVQSTHFAHLQDLNPQQREAVEHGDGPLLIFAGAGSGKTRVLTRRIAHLILHHGVDASEILAVTFTNKAAREMKVRVATLFHEHIRTGSTDRRQSNPSFTSEDSLPIWVSTFHSSCVKILRRHAKFLDFTQYFNIYDSSDSLSAMKRVYKSLQVDPKTIEPRAVLSAIDRAKNDYRFPEDLKRDIMFNPRHTEMIAELYAAYQAELRRSNAMDFGDLICNVVTLFKLEPKILERYNQQLRHILVDEYQDTNRVQYMLIRQLTERHHNICVVGDDDQSIYGFRGANVETILNFKEDFPEAKTITLEQNYRSTQNILTAANAVISHNKRRQKKTMFTENSSGDAIVCFRAFDEKDEAEFVAREITLLLRQGVKTSEIAIFYRTNAQSRAVEESLCESALPYKIFGGNRFYDRKEIKDILSYLRLMQNPADNEAFLRIVNTPARGIGATTLAALISHADKSDTSYFSILKNQGLPPALTKKFASFVEVMEKLQSSYQSAERILQDDHGSQNHIDQTSAIAYLLKDIAEHSGYLNALRQQDTLEAESRIENLQELSRVAVDFAERAFEQGSAPSISDFLDRSSLHSDLDESKMNADPVSLMTLHLAKGLEFHYVFLLGLEEGILPHIRSIDQPDELEEERRLCYVGLTRAEKRLYLTRATDRQSFGRSNWYAGEPSRFIWDLPQEILDDRDSEFLSRY